MKKLFRKDTPVELTQYYSLLWDPIEPRVDFKPVIDLVKRCNLELVEMTYYPGGNRMLDNRRLMKFGLKGIIQNLEMFEFMTYQNPELQQFMDNSDIEP